MDVPELSEDIRVCSIQPRPPGVLVPLTSDQMNHWNYVERQQPSLSTRLRAAATQITGPLDVAILRESLGHIVERHESLRTRIIKTDGVPHNHVDAAVEGLLNVNIAAGRNQQSLAQNHAESFFHQRVDLSVGPLFSAQLLTLSTTHVLLLALDHVVGDGISNTIVSRELWTAYSRAIQGQSFSLHELPVQFSDYALWRHLTRESLRIKHEAYWNGRLSGAQSLVVPHDFPNGSLEDDVEGQLLHLPLGKALSDELRILAKQERTLLAAIVLSAYVVSMSRWCRSDDLLIGFVSHGRHGRPELENMVGCLARTIYLRIPVVPSETLRDLLQKTHHELLLALQHEDFVPPLPPEKATGLLFSWGGLAAHFGRRSASAQQDAVPRLRLQPFPTHSRWPHKLLTFFSDTPSGVVVTASYRPDLLRKESIMRFGNNVQRVAQVLTRELDVRIGSLDLDDD